jgi:hypothetical protein
MEALDIYGNELRTFLGIGVFVIPIGLFFNALRIWASDLPPLEWVDQYFNDTNAGKLTATLLVAVFQQIAMLLLIAPAIIFAMREIRLGIKPGVWRSYKQAWRRLPSLIITFLAVIIIVAAFSWTIFLVPIAIYLLVRLQFFSQEIVLDDERGLTDPLRESWRITHGRWLHTFTLTLAFQLLALVPAPLVGIVLMVIGGTNVRFANGVSSLLYGLLLPLSTIGITLAYRRLKGHSIIEPHMLTQERDPKKAAESQELREEAARQQSANA